MSGRTGSGLGPAALLVAAALLLAGCGQVDDSARSASPDMPALSENLASMQDFYRIEFLPDGYPGRREGDETWAHPIYGTYVLTDYLDQYAETPTPELRQGIATVAKAAIDRMDGYRGTLVFWYQPAPERGARLYERHYSGLTQSYYAVALQRAGIALKDPGLVGAAEKVFASLLIPTERGGVLMQGPSGPGIAEVPQEPESWILNGWQSALVSMQEYADLADSDRARRIVRDSAEAMAAMMPLYDLPELANSRYGLTGFLYLRAVFDKRPVSLSDARLHLDGESLPLHPREDATRWESYVFGKDLDAARPTSRSVRMNVVASRTGEPTAVVFDVKGAQSVTLQAQVGRYDPLASSPVDPEWVDIDTVDTGDGTVEIELPEEVVDQAVYPTNFAKRIQGEQVNIYHQVHVDRLRELARITGVRALDRWADRWERYICRWPRMHRYSGLKVRSDEASGAPFVSPAEYCDNL